MYNIVQCPANSQLFLGGNGFRYWEPEIWNQYAIAKPNIISIQNKTKNDTSSNPRKLIDVGLETFSKPGK